MAKGEPKAPIPTERQVQRGILAMAKVCFPEVLLHHSPNGGHLAGGPASRFKQMGALKGDGLKPGFPDLVAVWDNGVAFLEVKRPKGSVTSPEQTEMLTRLISMGHRATIVKSVEDAYHFLTSCGAPRKADLQ
jgi:hypothetical protein